MHQQIGKTNKIIIYLFILFFSSTLNNLSYVESNFFRINFNKIKVYGFSEERNINISNSFSIINQKNIFSLNHDLFLEILNKNNLIHSFNVKKIYPDSIEIKLTKTKFLAITNLNNNKYFIGSNYKFIKFEKTEKIEKKLPYVFGKIEIDKFIDFNKVIDQSYIEYKDISEFYYFPSGRWDLKNNDNILIKLPEKNLLDVLNLAHRVINNNEFINHNVIDLRNPKQLIIYNE